MLVTAILLACQFSVKKKNNDGNEIKYIFFYAYKIIGCLFSLTKSRRHWARDWQAQGRVTFQKTTMDVENGILVTALGEQQTKARTIDISTLGEDELLNMVQGRVTSMNNLRQQHQKRPY